MLQKDISMRKHRAFVSQTLFMVSLTIFNLFAVAETPLPEPETPTSVISDTHGLNIPSETVAKISAALRPAIVRIHVVETYYQDGREQKSEASGSGFVIHPQGYIVTNHHVAGNAKQLKCVFADKTERPAELVGTDPLTDISVIKVNVPEGASLPVIEFGDSDAVHVGDPVLAMGSPLALSQSVTLGIVSNTEMIMPEWLTKISGPMEMDGEDVGSLVRWIGHDAEIHPGNSGGPLVNLKGKVIGVNEIKLALSGAIPGNLAREVAHALIEQGYVRRAWLGVEIQPLLKTQKDVHGALVSGVLKGSPAEAAGLQSGDILLALNNEPLEVRFAEQLPDLNRKIAALPIGSPVPLHLRRGDQELTLTVEPTLREPTLPKQQEFTDWGFTARNLSFMLAKELKRTTTDGVLVTSVRAGGPSGDAKPPIQRNDILVEVAEKPVRNMDDLRQVTTDLLKDATEPVPALVTFERKREKLVTVVKVGVRELKDPGKEVKKAWLPVQTQVVTREMAALFGKPEMKGFRITHVYKGSSASAADLRIGDIILAVDDTPLEAATLEQQEELNVLLRQYPVGAEVTLQIRREGREFPVKVTLERTPELPREMKKYEDKRFEFTARDLTYFDRTNEQMEDIPGGVLIEQVKSGSWAALGGLQSGDVVLEINQIPVQNVVDAESIMTRVASEQTPSVVFKILRGIHTLFVEVEPKWDQK